MQETSNNKRSSKRIPFFHSVHYGEQTHGDKISLVTNLCTGGLFIKDNLVLAPDTQVHIAIRVDKEVYEARGTVAWSNNLRPSLARVTENGMGIKFDKVDERLIKTYNDEIKTTVAINPVNN